MAEAYSHIACCIDGSPASDAALAAAIRMHALGPGRLTLVHVLEAGSSYTGFPSEDLADEGARARAWLQQMLALAPGSEGVILEGHAATVIPDWAGGAGVDLLIAVRHHGRAERLLLGGFTQHIVYHPPCAVLLVHPRSPQG